VIDLDAVRADFPPLLNAVCLDNGTVGLTPRPVAEALEGYLRQVLADGPPHVVHHDEEHARRERSMATIARFLGTTRERLALQRGVSEAYHTVLGGLDLRAGDEIVLGADEEASLLLPTLHLRDALGLKVVVLPFAQSRQGPRPALERVLSDRTRLVALSHVTTTAGYRYPVAELCAAARERGVPTFLDLAHSAGLVPMALDELGCDFAGILSYKWMYAPYAAGALYVRPGSLDRLRLAYAGTRSEAALDPEAATYALRDDARRFEYGPWAWSLVHAWATGVEYLERLGPAEIWEKTRRLVDRLRERLAAIGGVDVLTPASGEAAALVTFELPGTATGEETSARIRAEHGIRVKGVPGTRCRLRASIAVYTSEEDVEALAGAVEALLGVPA
jgi:selenocysteine lyase/cysteine desulfurase